MTNTNIISWKQLIASDGNLETGNTLERMCELDDASLVDGGATVRNGQIVVWPSVYLSAPGEEPDDTTPHCDVDWCGFEAERQRIAMLYGIELKV